MATYQIEWKKSALRELKRLDGKIIPRVNGIGILNADGDNAM